ncbi:MAG: F0F1 ATP synthase subunit B [Cyclobacteriaceae bacterium]|nr:F0F1 ATP synthase subunit B [Cyclobacteriaceae bacterium]
MDLLTPGPGLVIWQLFVFILLVLLLGKLAWKPILTSLKEREESIQQALDSAENAKKEMASLKEDNEKLLRETRDERDKILRDARTAANRIHDDAQANAKKNADRLIEDAKSIIQTEKNAALREVKEQVAMFSLDIAEKLIKKNLSDDKSQKELANTFIKDLKLN